MKLVNASDRAFEVPLKFDMTVSCADKAAMTVLSGRPDAYNSVRNPEAVTPKTSTADISGSSLKLDGMSVVLLEI